VLPFLAGGEMIQLNGVEEYYQAKKASTKVHTKKRDLKQAAKQQKPQNSKLAKTLLPFIAF